MNKDMYYMLMIDVQYLLSIYANDWCAIFTLNININRLGFDANFCISCFTRRMSRSHSHY